MSIVPPDYSTKKISETLLRDIASAVKSVQNYGSVELYVQDGVVTQITTRTIKKTVQQRKAVATS